MHRLTWKTLAFLTLLASPITTWGQTTIYDVVNYGSRIGSGLPSAGIAQGALFAVIGANLGPADAVQAQFPLPTTDGLGGVTATVTASDGSTLNAIMVYAAPNEVDAILPSSTPLGTATVTVNNSGVTASFSFNVVQTAFGVFTRAGAFAVNPDDGSTTLISPTQSALPGQTVLISGTGLGAIASDETQPGAIDVPAASITVWVGTTPASFTSAGRGTCCTGIDPNFPIPQGIAAWDVIAVTIPDGVQGCQVSVVFQSGNTVSNSILLAVNPAGGTCPEALLQNGGTPVLVSGLLKTGIISMTRSELTQDLSTVSLKTITDVASAAFFQTDYGPVPVPIASYSADLRASVGSCWAFVSSIDTSIPVVPPTSTTPTPEIVYLDAGTQLTITNPKMTQAMPLLQPGIYGATAFTTTIALPGLDPMTSGGPDFIIPGPYTLDNGAGGADIGAFANTLVNPTPVTWTNMVTSGVAIDRSQGIPITWTGGDPDGVVSISGASFSKQGTMNYYGSFFCYASVNDGQFTVPAFITQQLPPTGDALAGSGLVQVAGVIANLTTNFPGLDLLTYFSQQIVATTVSFQ